MKKDNTILLESEDTTTTGGSAASTRAAIHVLGFSDTQIDPGVFDSKGRVILTQVSLRTMGNTERQARKGKERSAAERFGEHRTEPLYTDKAPVQHLDNVLRLSHHPGWKGPRPR